MNTYRVWFMDGTAVLVNAEDKPNALEKALAIAEQVKAVREIEQLD